MRKWFVAAGLLLALATLWAPQAQAAPARQAALPTDAVGVEWSLVSLTPAGGAAEDTTGGGITLTLNADGTANGSGGCNNFNAGYTLSDGGGLEFGPAASTLRLCGDPADRRESAFYLALDAIDSYSLADGRLTLTGGGAELVFASGAAAPPATTTPPATLPPTGGETATALLLLLAALGVAGGLWLRRGYART